MSRLLERLKAPGPKRILALDGGGMRGAMAVGFVEKLEQMLRQRYNKPDLLLCDYFDLIGGTSTGALIASGLSVGFSAAEIKRYYLEIGSHIFGVKRKITQPADWKYLLKGQNFDYQPLESILKDAYTDITIGDERIRTGLCVVTKRADTQSTWPIINHPEGKYFEFNKDIPLWQAVRASSAAPGFFRPEKITVGNNETAVFVDGGMSMFNNPSFLLFLIATLSGFPFHWQTGHDNLLLISIGTGAFPFKREVNKTFDRNLLGILNDLPNFFMADANILNQTILQYLSNSPTAIDINSEMGNLQNDLLTPQPALTYLRYNVLLDHENLNQNYGLSLTKEQVSGFRNMANTSVAGQLAEIGEVIANQMVLPEHLPKQFDLF